MTYDEAKAKAEETVLCDMTIGGILCACMDRNIPIIDKKGKRLGRGALEQKLIKAMTEEMSGGDAK